MVATGGPNIAMEFRKRKMPLPTNKITFLLALFAMGRFGNHLPDDVPEDEEKKDNW